MIRLYKAFKLVAYNTGRGAASVQAFEQLLKARQEAELRAREYSLARAQRNYAWSTFEKEFCQGTLRNPPTIELEMRFDATRRRWKTSQAYFWRTRAHYFLTLGTIPKKQHAYVPHQRSRELTRAIQTPAIPKE